MGDESSPLLTLASRLRVVLLLEMSWEGRYLYDPIVGEIKCVEPDRFGLPSGAAMLDGARGYADEGLVGLRRIRLEKTLPVVGRMRVR